MYPDQTETHVLASVFSLLKYQQLGWTNFCTNSTKYWKKYMAYGPHVACVGFNIFSGIIWYLTWCKVPGQMNKTDADINFKFIRLINLI